MSDLLRGVKSKDAASSAAPEPISLEELLLDEMNAESPQTQSEEKKTTDQAPQSKSRKARRNRIKATRSVVAKTSDQSTKQKTEQKRRMSEFQERNKKALLKRQKQANQRSRTGSRDRSLEYVGSVGNKNRGKNQKVDPIATVQRPVVIASADFHPSYTRDGSISATGNLMKVKRSARRIKVDKVLPPYIPNTIFKTPALAAALAQFSQSKSDFMNSLSPDSISMYDDAISAFGLTLEENVSNTEIIYTLLREFALAAATGSSRLDESSDRSLDGDPQLVDPKDNKIEAYYRALKQLRTRDQYNLFQQADQPDIEVAVKCLTSILAKEIVLSYNMQKNADSDTGRVNRLDFEKELRVKYMKEVLTDPDEIKSQKSAHGIIFGSLKDRKKITNYPFESTEVISKFPTKAAKQFVDDLVDRSDESYDSGGGAASSPYEATLDSFDKAASKLTSMFSSSDLSESGELVFTGLLNNILQSTSTTLQSALKSSSLAAQAYILKSAASDKDLLSLLLIYLAFRSERVNGFSGGDAQPDGPSAVIRRNSSLKRLVGSIKAGKVSKEFTVSPQTVNLDPGVDGTTTFEAPSTKQNAQLETEPAAFQEGTLESSFGVSFEEVCSAISSEFNNFLRSTSNKSSSSFTPGTSLSLTIDQLQDCMTDITTQGSLFDYILSYEEVINSFLPTADSEITSIFDGTEKTYFSRIYRRSMFIAFCANVCKVVFLLIDERSFAETTKSVSSGLESKSSGKFSFRAQKSIGLSQSIKSFTTKGFASKGTSSPANLSIEFSSDFPASLSDMSAYLSSEEQDVSDISDTYPLISSIVSCLQEEEQFLRGFLSSIADYFSTVNSNYDKILDSLNAEVDGVSLGDLIDSGLVPSVDVSKYLASLSVMFNDPDMTYRGMKFRDNTIGKNGLKFLLHQLQKEKYRSTKKMFVIGLPPGILEDAESTPAEIGEIRKNKKSLSSEYFKIVVQKIDQVNPDIEFKDVEFVFSRDLFCVYSAPTGESAKFVTVDKNLDVKTITQNQAANQFGLSIVDNHLTDLVLKKYSDLQLDLDFYEAAFPASTKQQEKILSSDVNVPAFSGITSTSDEFLSGSNLAFDPENRNVESFDFYNSSDLELSLKKVGSQDPYGYSFFDYVGTYGSFFLPDVEESKLTAGVEFEKVICLLIDDDDFEESFDMEDEDTRDVVSQIAAQRRSEKAVTVGAPTSNGVDLCTYRFSIEVGSGAAFIAEGG